VRTVNVNVLKRILLVRVLVNVRLVVKTIGVAKQVGVVIKKEGSAFLL